MATHQSSKDTHIEQQADTQIPKTPKPKNLGGNLAQAIFQHYPEPTLGDEVAAESTRWLLVSPYPEHEHLLNLTSLDTPNRLLALAAVEMEPATEKYATVKYEEAIDWSSLMFTLKSLAAQEGYRWTRHEFYVVEFRSKLKKSIDSDLLFKLDKESHIEATASGGLLKYWYGIPDVDRRNLATCLWRNKEDAVKGGRGPWHKQARAVIPKMYEAIDVKGLRLVVEDDVSSWTFEPYH